MKLEQVLLNVPIRDEDDEYALSETCPELKAYIKQGFVIKQISAAGARPLGMNYSVTVFCCVVLLERVIDE